MNACDRMSSASAQEGAQASIGKQSPIKAEQSTSASEQGRQRRRRQERERKHGGDRSTKRNPSPSSQSPLTLTRRVDNNNGATSQFAPGVERRQQSREQDDLNESEHLLAQSRAATAEARSTNKNVSELNEQKPSGQMVFTARDDELAQARIGVDAQVQDQVHSQSVSLAGDYHDQEDQKRPLLKEGQQTVTQAAAERKWSQCSATDSQVSTSFGCSLTSSALNSSRRSSSVCIGLDQQGFTSINQASVGAIARSGAGKFILSKLARKSSSIVDCFNMDQRGVAAPRESSMNSLQNGLAVDNERNPAERLTNMSTRTISQSMLELDESGVSPRDKFQVDWRNLEFAYEQRNGFVRAANWLSSSLGLTGDQSRPNHVLKNISGGFKSNQLVAIIGPSGCGKTTLLQFLAGNNRSQSDRMRIRGIAEPKVAYIGQDDSLLPGLTARETLMYASRLQNSRSGFDHAKHIEPILQELGLAECAERNVSKLSGGQAKRVTIAQELLYPTNLLILDEVTSGLDASTSYSIVKLLKYLVSDQSYPMSIVMSIHQPSARLFSVFDRVYVMSEGYCLYEGSCQLGQINEYLGRFGLVCPQYHNIADYLIELACSTPAEEDVERRANLSMSRNGWNKIDPAQAANSNWLRSSKDHQEVVLSMSGENRTVRDQMVEYQRKLHGSRDHSSGKQEPAQTAENEPNDPRSISLYFAIEQARRRRPRPFWSHFQTHLSRSLLRIRRSYILTYLQLLTYIALGVQLATFYGPEIGRLSGCPRLPTNLMSYVLSGGNNSGESPAGEDDMALEVRRIQENMNFLLVTVMTATFAALEITVITFPLEAKTVKREWRNGWYRVSSYFFGRTLADLPFQLVFVLIFCLLVYTLTGQIGLDTWRFGAFVATIVMTALVAQSIGFIFGAVFMDNLPAAVFTAPLAIFPALLFSGFFSRVSQIPSFYQPMTHFSHFRYAFDALLVSLYGHNRCNCDQTTLSEYHASMRNQTNSLRDMFSYLFGASDCAPQPATQASTTMEPTLQTTSSLGDLFATDGAVSQSDLSAIQSGNSTLAAQVLQTIQAQANQTATTVASVAPSQPAGSSFMKPLEDALIEGVFDQMMRQNSSASTPADSLYDDGGDGESSVMDRLAGRFSTRLTGLLNKQANFGHSMPTECRQFNSYLLTEFDLHDEDLLFGLLALFAAVILTRILCNCLLNYTIATRVN